MTNSNDPTLRAFFAVDLSLQANEEIQALMRELKSHLKSPHIRWTQPENLHVTLQFLAHVKKSDIPKLITEIKTELANCEYFTLTLGQVELFPTKYRPHVISMQVFPEDRLAMISEKIGKVIVGFGYEVERRPFRAHLTLARIKTHDKKIVLPEFSNRKFTKSNIEEIIFYQSVPAPTHSTYIKLDTIYLSQRRG